jgi:membrane associated rhomboid family serine protease
LALNMWALWVFGNPVNHRLGNAYYALVYLGAAVLLGLFARLIISTWLLGASGAIFAVIAVALILMPRASVEIACVAFFPLTLVIGLLSKPAQPWQWLLRSAVYGIPALWALTLIPLMQLFLFWCDHWNPSSMAHLLGMLCGVGAVLLLPTRVTMRHGSLVGA